MRNSLELKLEDQILPYMDKKVPGAHVGSEGSLKGAYLPAES